MILSKSTNLLDNYLIFKKTLFMLPLYYILILLDINSISYVNGMTAQEVEAHLEMGKKLLATGQLADALTQFHSAIDGDPNNYMSYYRRGTVFLAMGRFKSALSDLDHVIELKPDFDSARLQRANVLLKQGVFDKSIKDYETIIQSDQSNTEAKLRLDKIFSILNDLGNAKRLMANRDYGSAIEIFTQLLEICPWSTELHDYRSDCYLNIGEVSKAILDISALAKLIPDNTDAYYKLSELHYSIGEADYALNNIRECLRLDPDLKKCTDYYKMLRKLTKLIERMKKSHDEKDYADCIIAARSIIENDKNSQVFYQKGQSFICSCNSKAKNTQEAIESCSELLKSNPNDAETLYNRAQAHIVDENLDDAQRDCQKAHEQENSQRTGECMEKINKLIKQSKKRDYYKILGVKRSADKNTIIKAYRKLAHKWHPDRFDEKSEKDKAQKVFIDIAAAKEVLTDPEKRAKFDNGEDPLDPEEQAHGNHHGGFNPFQQGFNPFGQGGQGGPGGQGFQFKFKFN